MFCSVVSRFLPTSCHWLGWCPAFAVDVCRVSMHVPCVSWVLLAHGVCACTLDGSPHVFFTEVWPGCAPQIGLLVSLVKGLTEFWGAG